MSKFSAPAILTRIAYLKDGGLSLGFATNELSDEDKVIASRFHQKFGYVLFQENQYVEEDLPKGDAEGKGKTPSQRLRAVMFILWRQRYGLFNPAVMFDAFYAQEMEKLIDRFKKLLAIEGG